MMALDAASLETTPRAREVPLSLYVHLPWCVRKCPYCDFNSHQLTGTRPDERYIDALIADLDADLPTVAERRIGTIFFGGGTPSLFPPEAFAKLLREVRARIAVADDAEITLEANPGTIERGRFHGYRVAGINRVSLGAQSFDPVALGKLGRIHSAEETFAAIREMRLAGIANFNVDLMYALPGQSLEAALADIRTACELGATHLSHYQLTMEPGTVFHARPPAALPDDDLAYDMQTACQALLAAQGYAQYEVSAYARAGFQCRHNLNYWGFGDYLGIGAGAHGKLSIELPANIVRTVKAKSPSDYQRRAATPVGPIGERSAVDPDKALVFEFMLNALRLNAGFSLADFERHTGLPGAAIRDPMLAARGDGLLERTCVGWRATPLGRRFLNDLQMRFLA